MTTDVIHSIGATNSPIAMDYSTLAAWAAACPADLRAGSGTDQQWIGEVYNQGELIAPNAVSIQVLGDTTHRVILRAATGHSFIDSPTASTDPLRYNPSVGAAIHNTHYSLGFRLFGPWFEVTRLQIRFDGHAYGPSLIAGTGSGTSADGISVHECIISCSAATAMIVSSFNPTFLTNCVFINETTGSPTVYCVKNLGMTSAAVTTNCTFVSIGGSSGYVMDSRYGYVEAYNCAFFNVANPLRQIGGSSLPVGSALNNITDQSSFGVSVAGMGITGAAFTTANFTALSGVTNGPGSGLDLRLPLTSALLDAGNATTYASIDIFGTTRPQGSAPDIGAFEVPQAAPLLGQGPFIIWFE